MMTRFLVNDQRHLPIGVALVINEKTSILTYSL